MGFFRKWTALRHLPSWWQTVICLEHLCIEHWRHAAACYAEEENCSLWSLHCKVPTDLPVEEISSCDFFCHCRDKRNPDQKYKVIFPVETRAMQLLTTLKSTFQIWLVKPSWRRNTSYFYNGAWNHNSSLRTVIQVEALQSVQSFQESFRSLQRFFFFWVFQIKHFRGGGFPAGQEWNATTTWRQSNVLRPRGRSARI